MARKRGLARIIHYLSTGLFLPASALVWLRLMRLGLWFDNALWPEGLLIVLATATTLTELGRWLPSQNVLAAAVLIAVVAGTAQCLSVLSGIPFGHFSYTRQAGPQLFHPLPLAMPLLWVVVLLNARGVVRLALRPCRGISNYGYWLLGLSVALLLLMDFGLEPFATRANQYWVWKQGLTGSSWYDTPWVNFLGWALCALAILAFVTPFLINKARSSESPSLHPLIVWLVLNALILTGLLTHHLWLAAGLIISYCLVIAVFAVVGCRHDMRRV